MTSPSDRAIESMLHVLAENPERAKVIKGYPYRTAKLGRGEGFRAEPIDRFYGLWVHLSEAAGWYGRNNHSVFVFEYEGQRRAVRFSDLFAYFGREEDVFESIERLDR